MHRFALGTYFYLLENECKEEGDKSCVDPDTVSRFGWLPLASFRKSEHLCKMINLNLPGFDNGVHICVQSRGRTLALGHQR